MSSSRVPEPELTMADLIDTGRIRIKTARTFNSTMHICGTSATENYERALELLTMAMRSCLCARGIEHGKCTCKYFETICDDRGSIFRSAMRDHVDCEVPWKYSKCDDVLHIEALDLRAATYEAMGKLDLAIKDAEWMVELAPQLPDGYLRLGNLARLQGNEEYAWNMYQSGIDANMITGEGSSPKLQQLHALRRHALKKDPICLPAEIVGPIFSYLSWIEILRILRVSKQWKRVLTSPVHGRLWRDIVFPHRFWELVPLPSQLREILSWAGDGGARRIVINNGNGFTDPIVTQLLEASPSLEYLKLNYVSDPSLRSTKKIWNQLRSFTIRMSHYDRPRVDSPRGFPRTFLQNATSSLEHLDLEDMPCQWYHEPSSLPLLPRLKTLRMSEHLHMDDRTDYTPFPIFPLSVAFPRLEQLWIDSDIPYLTLEPLEIWRGKWDDVWPHLKVLKFNCTEYLDSIDIDAAISHSTLRYLMSVKSLQHLRLDFKSLDWNDLFRGRHSLLSQLDVAQYTPSRNLRSFILSSPISPGGARTLVSNAIETGQLTSFDIVFPEDSPTGNIGVRSIRHLKGYEWMRGAPSIHTLGCYKFSFPLDAETDEDLPLPQFLATFPNLRTLKICSWEYSTPEFIDVVVAVLEVTRLETIYTPCVDGLFFDQLRETAQDYGVQLLADIPKEQWPMPLEP
ncbi:hypothetical protein E4U11_004875 [Claviceps purpurea]|nr:hypothetical protein E4U11_004875 [Claviceps purpurea]